MKTKLEWKHVAMLASMVIATLAIILFAAFMSTGNGSQDIRSRASGPGKIIREFPGEPTLPTIRPKHTISPRPTFPIQKY